MGKKIFWGEEEGGRKKSQIIKKKLKNTNLIK